MRILRFWLRPVLAGMLVGIVCGKATAETNNGSVTLQWTAPGDDSLTGIATRYDLRYSLFPIDESNFVYCSGPSGLPKPLFSGTTQKFTVLGLLPGLRYYFAIKTADERLNWSRLSNVVAFAQPNVAVDPVLVPQVQFASPVPNPAAYSAGFSYTLPEASRVLVEIYDVQGRYVRRLINETVPAGSGVLTWDLRDHQGQRLPPGAYLARARLGDSEFRRRVVVTR